jgi:hypothetical protein
MSIGDEVFNDCTSLTKVTIPKSVTSIGRNAFYNCQKLGSLTISEGVESIGNSAFSSCYELTSVIIPSTIVSLGDNAFSSCGKLQSVTISDGLKSIGESVFAGCSSLSSVSIPNSVTSIGISSFNGCGQLSQITFPEGLTSIRRGAFIDCGNLKSITIPSTVTSIGESAFEDCSALISIKAESVVPIDLSFSYGVFDYVDKTTCKLYVPLGSKSLYAAAAQWKDFNIIEEFSTNNVELIDVAGIAVYPNPASDGFRVSGLKETSMLCIFDLNGKLLLSKRIVDNEYVFVNSLPKGVYLVRISSKSAILEKKIAKE